VFGDDLPQARLAVPRAVDERLIRRLNERRQLLDGRLAELRHGLGDEVGPELARVLVIGSVGRLGEIDELLDEAERGELARPGPFGGEDDGVAPLAQNRRQANALIRRSIGRLRPEHDRQRCLRSHMTNVQSRRRRRQVSVDLKRIQLPVLVMHGDDDQIVPYADAGPLSAELFPNGVL
jgi:pimeloyl-ACP methyl ester carboxylesterase